MRQWLLEQTPGPPHELGHAFAERMLPDYMKTNSDMVCACAEWLDVMAHQLITQKPSAALERDFKDLPLHVT